MKIDVGNPLCASVKCRYEIPFDVFENGYRGRGGFVPLAIELDDVRFGEVVHTTVCAPEGMRFVPARFYWKQDKETKKRGRCLDRFFVGQKRGGAEGPAESSETDQLGELDARGAMTSQRITLKTKAPWMPDGSERVRPLTDDPEMRCYYLESVIGPVMGMRTFGYTLLMVLSLAILVAIALSSFGSLASFQFAEVLSVGTLFTVAGVLTTFGASLERLSFARLRATSVPRGLMKACLVVDAVGVVLAALLNAAGCPIGGAVASSAAAAVVFVLLLVQMVWCVRQWWAQRSLDNELGAYDSREIPVLKLESNQL